MEKKNEPVNLTGKVKVNKDGEGKKFLKLFFTGSFKEAIKYAFDNVFVPYTKDAICRTSTNVVNYWVNGDKPSVNQQVGANRVSYWQGGAGRTTIQSTPPSANRPVNNVYSAGSLSFENRGDAEAVLLRLQECVSLYGKASVADLYDLAGAKYSFTDHNYGWTDLTNVKVIRNFDGSYSIDVPRAIPFK